MAEMAAPTPYKRKRPISPSPPPSPSLDDDAVACAGLKRPAPRQWPDPPELTAKPCGIKKGVCKDVHCLQCWPKRVASDARMMSMWTGTWKEAIDCTKGTRAKLTWQCTKEAGHQWQASVRDVCAKSSCPFPCCSIHPRLCASENCAVCRQASVIADEEVMKIWTLGAACARQTTKGNGAKVLWKCTKVVHHTWEAKVIDVVARRSRCPFPCCCSRPRLCENEHCKICLEGSVAGDARAMQLWALDFAAARKTLKCTMETFPWRCKTCNQGWTASPANIHSGTGCPHCCASEAETLVAQHFKLTGVKHICQFSNKQCKDKCVLRFDFFLHVLDQPLLLEVDGVQHFDGQVRGNEAFVQGRHRDLIKMRWALSNGKSMLRVTSRGIRLFKPQTWQSWLQSAVADHVVPSVGKPVIVLEDCSRYRTMFAECLRDDPALGPHVVFHPMSSS